MGGGGNKALSVITAHLKFAVTYALLGGNPAARLPGPRGPQVHAPHVAVDVEQEQALDVLRQIQQLAIALHLHQYAHWHKILTGISRSHIALSNPSQAASVKVSEDGGHRNASKINSVAMKFTSMSQLSAFRNSGAGIFGALSAIWILRLEGGGGGRGGGVPPAFSPGLWMCGPGCLWHQTQCTPVCCRTDFGTKSGIDPCTLKTGRITFLVFTKNFAPFVSDSCQGRQEPVS